MPTARQKILMRLKAARQVVVDESFYDVGVPVVRKITFQNSRTIETTDQQGDVIMSIEILLIALLIGFCVGLMVGVALAKPNILS